MLFNYINYSQMSIRTEQSSDNKTLFDKIEKQDPKTAQELIDVIDDVSSDVDDITKIFNYYKNTYNKAIKYANRFFVAYDAKNPVDILPYEELIRRAKKYKVKYNLSDNEFTLFLKMIKERREDKIKVSPDEFLNAAMSKTLGYERAKARLNVSPQEQQIVSEIIKLDKDNTELSKRVKLQSFSYGGPLNSNALRGNYDYKYHNVMNAIHPVIAALFIPKIDYFEERVVYADIANMVTRLSQHKPLIDGPTNALYQDLIHDPNNNSESYKISPIKDLSLRAQIQTCLWEIIINLRNGRYYTSKFMSRFMDLINKYPSNNYDASDTNIACDAGSVLRKIMNVFSMRPTHVGRTKIRTPDYAFYKSMHSKPDYVDLSEFVEKEELEDTAFIPMIVIRLPPRNINKSNSDMIKDIRISADLGLLNWYKNDHAPAIYNQKIIATNGVIIYYINRTYSTITYASPYIDRYGKTQNVIYEKIPPSIMGATNLNTTVIGFDPEISIDNTIYTLQSVICYENVNIDLDDNKSIDIAVGQSTIINVVDNMTTSHYWYNPSMPESDTSTNINPITMIQDISNSENEYAYDEHVSKYGSVFIYSELK